MSLAAPLAALAGIAGALLVARGGFAPGWALLLLSAVALRWPVSIWQPAAAERWSRRRRLAALALVTALAAFFRLYRLDQPGLWGDDAVNGLIAFDILDGRVTSPFEIVAHSFSRFHALANYPIAAAFAVFGADTTTLRLPGALLGVLCVPLLYGTVAPLFGAATGLVAAVFYATSPPQLIHAKELVQIITGQFFQLLGLCLLVQGLQRGRTVLVVAAGLPLALCVYTYHAARVAPLVAVVYTAAVLWAARGTPDARRRTLAGVAGLAVLAVALVPAIRAWVREPFALFGRVEQTSLWSPVAGGTLWPLWNNAWRTLSVFHYRQGPEYHWFGVGTDPALNAVVAFLAVHGLIETLRRWREPRAVLLLAWFAVGLAPAALSSGAPRFYRAFLASPPVYVWAALPIVQLLIAPGPRRARAVRRATAIALLAAVPLIDFNIYFYRVYNHPAFRWYQGERIVEAARLLRGLGPGWTGYLLADSFDADHETLRFLRRAWNLDLVDAHSLADVLPMPEMPERGAAYLMTHGTLGAAGAIARMYPGEPLVVSYEPPPRGWWLDRWWSLAPPPGEVPISAAMYPVPRTAAEHPHREPPWGLQVEYEIGGKLRTRHEPYPYYAFLRPSFLQPFNATWRGRLRVPAPGGYRVAVDANAPASLVLDGMPTGPHRVLTAGEHPFTLTLRNVPQRLRLAVYWVPPGKERELVPAEAFVPE